MEVVSIPIADIKRRLSLSSLSYGDQEEFKIGLKSEQIIFSDDAFKFICSGQEGTQLYVFVSNGVCEVCFRGSYFLQDSRFMLQSVDALDADVKVHTGFLSQYHAIEDALNTFLAKNADQYHTIVFSGHSLGAALATLSLVLFVDSQKDKEDSERKMVKCFTFGSPRVGNKEFCALYAASVKPENHWRVFNHHDVVTKMLTKGSYEHVCGNSLRLFSTSDLKGTFSFMVELNDNEHLDLMNDSSAYHHTEHYSECLSKCFPTLNNEMENSSTVNTSSTSNNVFKCLFSYCH